VLKKLVFFTLNTNNLQFVQSKFLKLLPHIFILGRCKIVQLDVQKNNFQIFLLFAIEMAVLSVFSQKKGLGPLQVKIILFHCRVSFSRMQIRPHDIGEQRYPWCQPMDRFAFFKKHSWKFTIKNLCPLACLYISRWTLCETYTLNPYSNDYKKKTCAWYLNEVHTLKRKKWHCKRKFIDLSVVQYVAKKIVSKRMFTVE